MSNRIEPHAVVEMVEEYHHRCLAGPACQKAEKIDGQRHGARTADPDTLCEPCTLHIADCARQLPRDYRMLAASLGERATDTGEYVNATPTPGIPINTQAETIMAAILEVADRAVGVISGQLGTDPPNGRRHLPDLTITPAVAKRLGVTAGKRPASVGTIALHTHDTSQPDPHTTLTTWARYIEHNISVLATAPPEDHWIWQHAQRCERHTTMINAAESMVEYARRDTEKAAARESLTRAYHAAARCDTCNGWGPKGQARGLTELTGHDIAQQIRDLHHRTRAHLGHTKLRHHYATPCPAVTPQGTYCGAMTVGRQDGKDWVDCTTCGTQWTEREYDWLKTQIAGDKEIDLLRYLLAEAYWRLDQINEAVSNSAGDPALELPGAGTILHNKISDILNGHQPPDKRKTTTDNHGKKR